MPFKSTNQLEVTVMKLRTQKVFTESPSTLNWFIFIMQFSCEKNLRPDMFFPTSLNLPPRNDAHNKFFFVTLTYLTNQNQCQTPCMSTQCRTRNLWLRLICGTLCCHYFHACKQHLEAPGCFHRDH